MEVYMDNQNYDDDGDDKHGSINNKNCPISAMIM
jgi:hypothetical protein